MRCIGIDGESIAPWGYCLLSSSSLDRLSERRRLTSRECFDFLLRQQNFAERPRLFGYGIGYDVCHWVADLSDDEKTRLATKGMVYTQQGATFYRLTYRPNAYFTVQRLRDLPRSPVVANATVVDLMRWHRKPFVEACEEWGAITKPHARMVRDLKNVREHFDATIAQTVETYCIEECVSLECLAAEMTSRLSDLGIPVSHPFTAGAVAGALMARNRVHDHWQNAPEGVQDAISRAFFGGREQCSRYGYFRDVTQWDIRSAYGWAMTQLPDMLGTWSHCRFPWMHPLPQEDWMQDWSLYKVQWDIDEGKHPVMPFPWRAEDGRVHYPPRGTGWHWSPVVRAALRHYPDARIQITDAWHYIPGNHNAKPFGYIGDLYSQRREAADDPVGGLLKSIIVATWGRLCSPGQRRSKTRGMLDWAGMTTALIQERMLDAIHATGEGKFISCCVDGFWTMDDTRTDKRGIRKLLDEETCLGGWSRSDADELLLLRPACYWKSTGGEWTAHTSGIPGGGGLVEDALAEWRKPAGWRQGKIDLVQRRCKGLLACSAEGNYDQLGQFADLPLSVTFNPGMGRMGHECPTVKRGPSWRRWLSYWPPNAEATSESASFQSRTGLIDDRWRERREANAIEETSE